MEYDRKNPYLATIKGRYSLCKPGSDKVVQHVVLDLSGSGIRYKAGDSIGVMPENPSSLVRNTLYALGAEGNESVIVREEQFQLKDYLTRGANLSDVNKTVLQLLHDRQTNTEKKQRLAELIESRPAFKEFQELHEVWDVLLENQEVRLDPQILCEALQPLLPRLYSISSSMQTVGEEVHLMIALLKYESCGHLRVGVCTHYLCEEAPLNQPVIPVYIQPNRQFSLPEDYGKPVIMIGPGTGVAPFRAFMQERAALPETGLNWLFFGDWNRKYHFFFEDYWTDLVRKGRLRLDTAFSRDQENKLYVQHKMLEHGEELYRLLEEGAYLYVCGDAERMAKDVEAALLQIIQKYRKIDEKEAREYLKTLRRENRYVRDVY